MSWNGYGFVITTYFDTSYRPTNKQPLKTKRRGITMASSAGHPSSFIRDKALTVNANAFATSEVGRPSVAAAYLC